MWHAQEKKQPLNRRERQVKILELKDFVLYVRAADLSWLRGFQPFGSWSRNTEIYVTVGRLFSKHAM